MTGYHQPVLLKESVDGLNIKPEGIYVDTTFGGGGHSVEILSRLSNGKLIAFDQDKDVLDNLPNDDRLIFVQHNFRFLRNFLKYHKIGKIDGLLADLGVSSHHFNTQRRGFSFRFDSTLDMRMNQSSDFSALDLLNKYSQNELFRIFHDYGEIKIAGKVARCIVNYRESAAIDNTRNLLEAVSSVLPRHNENQFLAKLYQAIRIEVNHEIDYLKEMLEQCLEFLKPGSRLSIISYHSLEDRLVKNFIKKGTFQVDDKIDLYGNKEHVFKPVNRKIIVPTEQEINRNGRARSAKLRIAEKL
jgi:16S rRNA (cytosine1402-N4)-methyltransferase